MNKKMFAKGLAYLLIGLILGYSIHKSWIERAFALWGSPNNYHQDVKLYVLSFPELSASQMFVELMWIIPIIAGLIALTISTMNCSDNQ